MQLFISHRANSDPQRDEPFGPGLYLLTTEKEGEKITFTCVVQRICTHSLVRRGYCPCRGRRRGPGILHSHTISGVFENITCSRKLGRDHRWIRSVCVCVCIKPWQQLWNQCCKSVACVTFWHRPKTAPPLPTTKGRGPEHVSLHCVAFKCCWCAQLK